ncbi:flagellin [Agrobacterium larrymoorei]|uniref:Flagellin n=1 Tax=Agrobacterium larrymoorei TaxID=160699 RepID=A0A4D7DIE4_9HYPH|nr:flagellin [Agrobacterium larrymoorei]QCI97083.1 flagellin [Agrobacterium larrymoorei]QYA07485.1 flagellin [Agrobacterium larrymoorei]WHA41762.1 flagellin [Agrobacterium larrymoorei]
MTSILTNTGAMTALQTLRLTNSQLGETQDQISSGLRVQTSSDNVAYWAIATTMKSDNKAINAVQDVLALSSAVIDTTYAAADSSIEVMSEIKSKLVTAGEPAADREKLNEDITGLKNQLKAVLQAASFNGENWLSWNTPKDSPDKQLISSFIRNSDGSVQLGHTTYEINLPQPRTDTNVQYFVDNGGSGEYGILSSEAFAVAVGSAQNYIIIPGATAPSSAVELTIDDETTSDELNDMLNTVDAMTKQMTNMATDLGSISSHLERSSNFAAKLSDTLESGISRLVDTDMEEASAKLSALQSQQQLAIQSLSIANSYSSNLLTLFR